MTLSNSIGIFFIVPLGLYVIFTIWMFVRVIRHDLVPIYEPGEVTWNVIPSMFVLLGGFLFVWVYFKLRAYSTTAPTVYPLPSVYQWAYSVLPFLYLGGRIFRIPGKLVGRRVASIFNIYCITYGVSIVLAIFLLPYELLLVRFTPILALLMGQAMRTFHDGALSKLMQKLSEPVERADSQ